MFFLVIPCDNFELVEIFMIPDDHSRMANSPRIDQAVKLRSCMKQRKAGYPSVLGMIKISFGHTKFSETTNKREEKRKRHQKF